MRSIGLRPLSHFFCFVCYEKSFEQELQDIFQAHHGEKSGAIGIRHARARWKVVRDAIGRSFIFSTNDEAIAQVGQRLNIGCSQQYLLLIAAIHDPLLLWKD